MHTHTYRGTDSALTDALVVLLVLLMVGVRLVDQVELLLGDEVAHQREAAAELSATVCVAGERVEVRVESE